MVAGVSGDEAIQVLTDNVSMRLTLDVKLSATVVSSCHNNGLFETKSANFHDICFNVGHEHQRPQSDRSLMYIASCRNRNLSEARYTCKMCNFIPQLICMCIRDI